MIIVFVSAPLISLPLTVLIITHLPALQHYHQYKQTITSRCQKCLNFFLDEDSKCSIWHHCSCEANVSVAYLNTQTRHLMLYFKVLCYKNSFHIQFMVIKSSSLSLQNILVSLNHREMYICKAEKFILSFMFKSVYIPLGYQS